MADLDAIASGAFARAPRALGSLLRLAMGRTSRVFLVRGLGVAALLGLEIVLSRSLGVGGYGTFALVLTIATVISRLAPLGWLNASTALLSAYLGEGHLGAAKGVMAVAHLMTLVGLAAAALAVIVARPWLGPESAGQALTWALPVALAVTLLELHRYVLRGLHAGDLGETLSVLVLPGLVIGAVAAFHIGEPEAVFAAYSTACLLMLVASTACIARRLPPGFWNAAAEFRLGRWSAVALAMLAGSLSDELIGRAAVLVLGSLGDERQLGLYQAAARLSLMMLFVLRALTPVAGPRISVLHRTGRMAELRSAYRRLCIVSLLGSLPFLGAFTLTPAWVLAWFGPDFAEAAPVLRVLSLGYLVSAAAGPCATALMMVGKERIYGLLAGVGLALNVVGSLILVPLAGALGAAIATAACVAGGNLAYLVVLTRAMRDSDHPPRETQHKASALRWNKRTRTPS